MQPLRQAAERAEISYRQAHYWAQQGWLSVQWFDKRGEPVDEGGTGYTAWIETMEVERLMLMGRLVRAGFQPQRAWELTKVAWADGEVPLGEGLHLRREARVHA